MYTFSPIRIIQIVAYHNWGVSRKILTSTYKTIIRAKLDYGCIVYSQAKPTYLKTLNEIQNTALKLITGASRTTAINSLLTETGEYHLEIRRQQLIVLHNKSCK